MYTYEHEKISIKALSFLYTEAPDTNLLTEINLEFLHLIFKRNYATVCLILFYFIFFILLIACNFLVNYRPLVANRESRPLKITERLWTEKSN